MDVAGDLMLFELIVVRVHCIVCIVCDWRSHDYLVVRIVCMVYVLGVKCAFVCTLYI